MELDMSDVDMDGERPSMDGVDLDLGLEEDDDMSYSRDPLQTANSTITIPVKTYQALQLGVVGLILLLAFSFFFFISMVVLQTGDSTDNEPSGPIDQAAYGEGHLSMQELQDLATSVNSSIDFTADPCQDFYQFSCGKWRETHEIPADRSGWYKSFSTIDLKNEEVLGKILKDDWPLLGTFYENCMDMKTRDEVGIAPLTPFIEEISQLQYQSTSRDSQDLAQLLAHLHRKGVSGLFSIAVEPNLVDPTTNILYVDQGGMGLPTRDYYFGESEHDIYIQEEYKAHLGRLFGLAGVGEGEEERAMMVERVWEVEKKLAEHALTPTERRNPYALNNPYTVEGLEELCPNFEWRVYFEELGIAVEDVGKLDVVEPFFMGNLSVFLGEIDDYEGLRDYFTVKSIVSASGWLTTDFVEEIYRWSGIITGASQPPNERICLGRVSSILGELLGRYYVNAVFDDRSKSISLDMIRRIEEAFVENLDTVDWMDDETAGLAVEKMEKITNKIGFTDKWRSYGKLKVTEGDFYGTFSSYVEMMFEEEIEVINKPVDKSKWFMNPQVVNAYYNPSGNEIVFPAAILQPTFFDRRYPVAFNFGGIGMVMGHELSHGFDDQGRQFDGDGRLVQWWSDEAIDNFDEAAQCVVDLYGNYSLDIEGEEYHLNGYLTLGENIADLGGVNFAFNAYVKLRERMEEEQKEKREEKVEWPYYPEKDIQDTFGFSSDQLFFLSMAQNWCSIMRDDAAIQSIQTDPHSPSEFRVKGPMSQTPQFAEAFSCPVNTPMHPESHCKVW